MRERYATLRRKRARLVLAHLRQPESPHAAEIAALDEQLDEIEAALYPAPK